MISRLFIILLLASLPFWSVFDWPVSGIREAPVAGATQDRAQGEECQWTIGTKRAGAPRPLSLRQHADAETTPDSPPAPTRTGTERSRPAIWGVATYYHPSLAGGLMRDGTPAYAPRAGGVAAATSWPLGTQLYVRGPTGRALGLVISDTGYLGSGHLDLSESDFIVLAGSLRPGVISVEIWEER